MGHLLFKTVALVNFGIRCIDILKTALNTTSVLLTLGLFVAAILTSCQGPAAEIRTPAMQRITKNVSAPTAVSKAPHSPAMKSTDAVPPTMTPLPTREPKATAAPSSTQTMTPTLAPKMDCTERSFDGDLLTIVTREFGLGRDFVPDDLIQLADHLPLNVTLGYQTEVREEILDPLLNLVSDMIDEGLDPKIISGYRSFPAQAIAWEKWREQEPERASIISAPAGYSEHQLGTTIDFGSPELEALVGQEGIEFHTDFYQTEEGSWLAENAHHYGFTLSYPRNAIELTGFFYEPWHYRFVEIELATHLREAGMFLTELLLDYMPEPCFP